MDNTTSAFFAQRVWNDSYRRLEAYHERVAPLPLLSTRRVVETIKALFVPFISLTSEFRRAMYDAIKQTKKRD
jgi:hypothetical protein